MGPPVAPPCQGGRWSGPWQEGEGFIYGRQRQVRWKEQVCLWWVAGAEVPVKVVVAEVGVIASGFTWSVRRPS